MATLTMEAGGREFTLRYTLQVIENAEEAYGSMSRLQEKMSGDDKPAQATMDMLTYMANAGEKHEGRGASFNRKWFRDNLSPKQLQEARLMTQHAIMVGMRREVSTDDDVPIDAVLREIEEERKKKRETSLGGKQLPAG